ncbi:MULTISPECIES: dioxygenase [unclassified Nocardiopsis]|uniref:dioxygenase family protein n=1 Tax=unclassified Nocardiopsis TaxID=2649073 RepID=UPI0013597B85|nr:MULTISPECIES: class III extradiol ring-cleavage dioxygenase [unclassified Nocardiopsis]
MAQQPPRMPTLYLSHGAPPLADDTEWTRQLADWSAGIPRPSAILIVSAHWEDTPLTVGATADGVPLTYDFWGFPQRYYGVTYPAPGAPGLARRVGRLVSGPGREPHQDPGRGLDHGAYVPLKEMYPEADVPVLQVSMPTLDPAELLALGRRLAPLRDEGVLIVGSGFTTHNLREMSRQAHGPAPAWSAEFDDWVHRAVVGHDVDALLDFGNKAPAAAIAHPRSDHFAPLFVAMGASLDGHERSLSTVDGFWYGLAKRSFQFD